MRGRGRERRSVGAALLVAVAAGFASAPMAAEPGVTADQVERAIKDGVSFLKSKQNNDGSWNDVDPQSHGGTTALVTLALLAAGETKDSRAVARALDHLRRFKAADLGRVYSVSLQTMAFAAADPDRFRVEITANVFWLEQAQIQPGDGRGWAGSWTYDEAKRVPGDNSNSHFALMALNAASEVGVKVDAKTWALARNYWVSSQRMDGGFTYQPDAPSPVTASMTCAGVSSLIITGLKRYQGRETIAGERIQNCGKGVANLPVEKGIDWLAAHFHVGMNFPRANGQWKYYYLYGLERTGRLAGVRFFGDHDWYREGAEMLVHDQKPFGPWQGSDAYESEPVLATSFALLFLAKGRTPVVINKVRHGPGEDWDNDHDDVRHLVDLVGRDWKHLLTWQTIDPEVADVEDMLQAPIAFMNGHHAPNLGDKAMRTLRAYVERGGILFAEACCGETDFDRGFRALMKEMFPEEEYKLHPLPKEHPVWRSRFDLSPEAHPLWGIEHGRRTVVIYSPADLSCFWNEMVAQPANVAVVQASKVGQNVVDYATGRKLPVDKLTARPKSP
jgi:hypothetical protein